MLLIPRLQFLYGPVPSSLKDLTVLQELNLAWNKSQVAFPKKSTL